MTLRVTDVHFAPARTSDLESGLLGFACVVFDEWLTVEGVTVRRTKEGRIALSFPLRTDSHGERRGTTYPRSDRARRAIETQVIAWLRERGFVT